jgi:site-specific DNA-methyltransferase (adenine-specific)
VSYRILQGDVAELLPKLAACSFDACLCDPPYGLGFMGKLWDHGIPSPEIWREVLRVLKPGAFLLAFGGTRTWHRLACAIEDAGFELRDTLMWLYGSGFPKSLDISKAIDKAAGAKREIIGENPNHRPVSGVQYAGIYAGGNTGGPSITAPATDTARQWSGYGTALKPAWEPILLAMKPCEGTFAENALKWGVAGVGIDGGRVETTEKLQGSTVRDDIRGGKFAQGHTPNPGDIPDFQQSSLGRWPANLILDEEAGAMLDEQSGTTSTTGKRSPRSQSARVEGTAWGTDNHKSTEYPGDSGGASRFFYTAKANTDERDKGLDTVTKRGRNIHPTVKPLDLCRYLAKLLLPPARSEAPRRIIVPFAGSGSEMIGAWNGGWDEVVGIEIDPHYVGIAQTRLDNLLPLLQGEPPCST